MKFTKFIDLDSKTLDVIINKHYNYWVKFNPLMDLEVTADKFKNLYAANREVPFGIAMFEDKILIGFCVFKKDNLENRYGLTPWIDGVMIFDEYRGKGYGNILMKEALNQLTSLGYKTAYLWTDQAPDFYKKLGFEFVQIIEKSEGGFGELYSKELN